MSNPKFWKTEQFKKLNEKWQQKLAKSGFEDVENAATSEATPIRWHNIYFKSKAAAPLAESRKEYFAIAFQFLHSYKFARARDRKIWELFADGRSYREIGRVLKVSKDTVGNTVKELKKVCFGNQG